MPATTTTTTTTFGADNEKQNISQLGRFLL